MHAKGKIPPAKPRAKPLKGPAAPKSPIVPWSLVVDALRFDLPKAVRRLPKDALNKALRQGFQATTEYELRHHADRVAVLLEHEFMEAGMEPLTALLCGAQTARAVRDQDFRHLVVTMQGVAETANWRENYRHGYSTLLDLIRTAYTEGRPWRDALQEHRATYANARGVDDDPDHYWAGAKAGFDAFQHAYGGPQ
jgi:hypothetical protein